MSICEFVQLCKHFFLSQLEKNHVTQLATAANYHRCKGPKIKERKMNFFVASNLRNYLWAVDHSFVTGVDYDSEWKEKSKKKP